MRILEPLPLETMQHSEADVLNLGGSTILAAGAARTIANNAVLLASTSIAGSNNLTINGTFTNSGGDQTLSIDNTGNTTLAGSVFLSESNVTGRTLLITGSGNATISGAIANSNGSGQPGNLFDLNSGILTLSNPANTFTGSTLLLSGEVRLNPSANATYASQIVLQGGTLGTTGIASGRTFTSSSTLQLNDFSTIALDPGVNHSVRVAPSNAVTWDGSSILTVTGWQGVGRLFRYRR
jgi:autotransporter-associated beta strand protein